MYTVSVAEAKANMSEFLDQVDAASGLIQGLQWVDFHLSLFLPDRQLSVLTSPLLVFTECPFLAYSVEKLENLKMLNFSQESFTSKVTSIYHS